ncbi:uncharacterized GTP-binding protein C02F5.3-like [Ochlerotatus camptorhynchus]|uniref:uncharacterized GTP-binding protein C02F5.3-like n=1 Tax=Ochlerotatus camptorhynchus TaxID=644619 RepID=UPI0031D654FC
MTMKGLLLVIMPIQNVTSELVSGEIETLKEEVKGTLKVLIDPFVVGRFVTELKSQPKEVKWNCKMLIGQLLGLKSFLELLQLRILKKKDLYVSASESRIRKPMQIKKGGGVSFNSTCPMARCNEKMVQTILNTIRIFNADVLFQEDCTEDELIDGVSGNRFYLPCIYVYKKIDNIVTIY